MSWVLSPDSALRSSCIVLHWILPLWSSHIIFMDYNGIHPVSPKLESGWLHVIYYLGWAQNQRNIVYYLLEPSPISGRWKRWTHCFWIIHSSKQTRTVFIPWVYLKRKSFICSLSGSQNMFGVLHFNPGWQHPKTRWLAFRRRAICANSCSHEGMTKTLKLAWTFLKLSHEVQILVNHLGSNCFAIIQSWIQPRKLLMAPLLGINSFSVHLT